MLKITTLSVGALLIFFTALSMFSIGVTLLHTTTPFSSAFATEKGSFCYHSFPERYNPAILPASDDTNRWTYHITDNLYLIVDLDVEYTFMSFDYHPRTPDYELLSFGIGHLVLLAIYVPILIYLRNKGYFARPSNLQSSHVDD